MRYDRIRPSSEFHECLDASATYGKQATYRNALPHPSGLQPGSS